MTKVIYALVDEEGVTRYVGQSKDPMRRFEFHVSQAFRTGVADRWPVHHWVYDQLIGKRHVPVIEVLEFCGDEEAFAVERKWIETFPEGQLMNVKYSQRHSEKENRERSERMRGTKLSEETRRKMSESAKKGWEKRRGSAAR